MTVKHWDPGTFILPTLHAALQTDDDIKLDIATEEWEEASFAYQEYLNSVKWPEWLQDFVLGEPHTGINSSDKLHDAELVEFWESDKKLIMVLSTRDCAWDARKAVVVVEYQLASPSTIEGGNLNRESHFLYDQFSDLGSGIFRHYILFSTQQVQIDFNYLKVNRFEL